MAVRKFKPTTPGQRHKLLVRSKKLLHPYQKNLSFTVSAYLAVATTLVR